MSVPLARMSSRGVMGDTWMSLSTIVAQTPPPPNPFHPLHTPRVERVGPQNIELPSLLHLDVPQHYCGTNTPHPQPPTPPATYRVMSVLLARMSSLGVMGDTWMSLSTARLAASASWILSGYEVTHTLNQPARSLS
jgi:hypothetical protein